MTREEAYRRLRALLVQMGEEESAGKWSGDVNGICWSETIDRWTRSVEMKISFKPPLDSYIAPGGIKVADGMTIGKMTIGNPSGDGLTIKGQQIDDSSPFPPLPQKGP